MSALRKEHRLGFKRKINPLVVNNQTVVQKVFSFSLLFSFSTSKFRFSLLIKMNKNSFFNSLHSSNEIVVNQNRYCTIEQPCYKKLC